MNSPQVRPKQISYDEFFEKFVPTQNIHGDAAFDGCMYETFGRDFDTILTQPANQVWTIVDCDGKLWIVSGLHHVNRFGYFVTTVPFSEEYQIEIED